jgi:hypothetical protein
MTLSWGASWISTAALIMNTWLIDALRELDWQVECVLGCCTIRALLHWQSWGLSLPMAKLVSPLGLHLNDETKMQQYLVTDSLSRTV